MDTEINDENITDISNNITGNSVIFIYMYIHQKMNIYSNDK